MVLLKGRYNRPKLNFRSFCGEFRYPNAHIWIIMMAQFMSSQLPNLIGRGGKNVLFYPYRGKNDTKEENGDGQTDRQTKPLVGQTSGSGKNIRILKTFVGLVCAPMCCGTNGKRWCSFYRTSRPRLTRRKPSSSSLRETI